MSDKYGQYNIYDTSLKEAVLGPSKLASILGSVAGSVSTLDALQGLSSRTDSVRYNELLNLVNDMLSRYDVEDWSAYESLLKFRENLIEHLEKK